jgi:antitoxin (DNA-binding transcriptional repressor) of toxin-antitoxin stability system
MTGEAMQQKEVTTQIVERADGGQTVVITQSDGSVQRIDVAADGKVVTSNLEGSATSQPAYLPEPPRRKQLPDGLVDMMGIIFGSVTIMSLGTPIVRAWARRFEKRTEMKQQVAVEQRLAAIEQAIETVAVEVERISEGQRFTTKLLADRQPAEMERVR